MGVSGTEETVYTHTAHTHTHGERETGYASGKQMMTTLDGDTRLLKVENGVCVLTAGVLILTRPDFHCDTLTQCFS